jgi:hypothetical protein
MSQVAAVHKDQFVIVVLGACLSKVMVSADGGKSWGEAALQGPVHEKAFTRFVMWPLALLTLGNVLPSEAQSKLSANHTRFNQQVFSSPSRGADSVIAENLAQMLRHELVATVAPGVVRRNPCCAQMS